MRKVGNAALAQLNRLPLPFSFDMANTVLLSGSPRSGTTWLGQVLSASPESALVLEPFDLKMPGLRRAGFTPRTYVDPEAEWKEGEEVFSRVFQGKGITLKLLYRNGRKLRSARGLVVKAIRANRMLPWLSRHFAIRGMLFIIRHPCAVVSSQMAHPDMGVWDHLRDFDRFYLERKLPHLIPIAERFRTEEEFRALTWCLDQHAPLASALAAGWTRISYEQLVIEGEKELQRLFTSVGMTIPPEALPLLSANSWEVKGYSVDHKQASVEERLGVWKKRLSPDQIARILAVVEACGIRGFSADAMPAVDEIGTVEGPPAADPVRAAMSPASAV